LRKQESLACGLCCNTQSTLTHELPEAEEDEQEIQRGGHHDSDLGPLPACVRRCSTDCKQPVFLGFHRVAYGADVLHFDFAGSAGQQRCGQIRTTMLAHVDGLLQNGETPLQGCPELLYPGLLSRVVRCQGLQMSQLGGQLLAGGRVWLQIAVHAGDEIAALAGLRIHGGAQHTLHLVHHLPAMCQPVRISGERANRLECPPCIEEDDDCRDQEKDRKEIAFDSRLHGSLIILERFHHC
jgi:hypothetical protein